MADKTQQTTAGPSRTVAAANQQQHSTIATPFNPYSTCSCTKILITQLFHEMKQEFPTVPDDIVWSYALKNCHNRPACIEGLRQQSEEYPSSVNAYPAALRQKPSTVLRRAPNPPHGIDQPSHSSIFSKNDRRIPDEIGASSHAQRPSTLNLVRQQTYGSARPPVSPYKTDKHVDTPVNVSLNVIVSPVTGRPPLQPMRITAAATDSQFENDPQQHIHRSVQEISPGNFRSVSFTLHKPNSGGVGGHLPNVISAEQSGDMPAKMGYQSRLEITVGGSNAGNASTSSAAGKRYGLDVQNDRNGISVMAAADLLDDGECLEKCKIVQ